MCKRSGGGSQYKMQNCRPSSIPIPQCIAPGTLAWSDGTRFQHFPQVAPNLLNQRQEEFV